MGSIREIGDFVAHSDARNKGLVTEDARDYFRILRIRPPNNAPFDLSDVLANFCLAVKGNFHRVEAGTIKRSTGLHKKVAEEALNNAMSKFHTNKQNGHKYLQ